MPNPLFPDPDRRPFRLRLRRRVRRAEVAVLGFGVVATGFLALHLAQRGNEVSLTERTAATSPTTPHGPDHVKTGATARPPSEITRTSPLPATSTTASTSPPTPPAHDTPGAVGADTTTTAPEEVAPTTTTSTSTTSSTTTTSPTTTTTTTEAPPAP